MAYQQRFVKNTSTPPTDSPLWLVGDGWKRSTKTNTDYCPIGNIIDDQLLVACRQESRKTVQERDYIQYNIEAENEDGTIDEFPYFFYVTDFNGNGKFSAFAYEKEQDAQNKKAEALKYANYSNSQQQQQNNNGQQKISSAQPRTPIQRTATVNGTNKTVDQVKDSVLLRQNEVLTFTDPQIVTHDNTEQMATLMQDGYSFIPSSLVKNNVWETEAMDEEGKVSKSVVFLMGKIINVKALDNNDIPVGA